MVVAVFPQPPAATFAVVTDGRFTQRTAASIVSERFIRCAHCGLPHEGHVTVCPTTGLRIDRPDKLTRRRKRSVDASDESPERMLGWLLDGRYRITGLIGQGGMSAIYEAQHLGIERRVAIKVLHPSLADDSEAIARLKHEAQVVSAIGHPNICEVYDLGRTRDGVPYLVMERLVGRSLADRIRVGPMGFDEVAPLLVQVLAALEAAHGKSVIHRDLKPENVFVETRAAGRVTAKLLDFGISKSMNYDFAENPRLTHTGMVMGTPYYMAPEQARGDSGLDQRVDLWAVGVILYEALTGRRPFVATNYNALLVKILTSRPRPVQKVVPAIPDSVAWLVDKALSKLREDRFQTAREFSDAIASVQRLYVANAPAAAMASWQARGAVPSAPTRQEPAARRSWPADQEDPETILDDESLRGDARPRPSDEQADDDDDDATLKERPRDQDDDVQPPRDTWRPPAVDPQDTEVMRRRDLERLAALDAGRPESVPPDDEDVQDTEVIRGRHGVPSAAPSDSLAEGPDTLEPNESDEGSTHPESDKRKGKTAYPDSERTLLYDIEAANEKLRARRLARGLDPEDDD